MGKIRDEKQIIKPKIVSKTEICPANPSNA
jgi:hypothetical protein